MISTLNDSEGVSIIPSESNAENEVWKDVPGYEGRYQVSSYGRVKNLKRKVRSINRYTGNEFFRTVPEHILRPGQYCKSGHISVVLEHGGKGKPVHQIVMKSFVGEPPEGMEVLHINGDPKDNRLKNLRYGSRTENILDTYQNGGRWRKLSIEEVESIHFSLYCGIRGIDLANEFQVSETTISKIKNGRTFCWLK